MRYTYRDVCNTQTNTNTEPDSDEINKQSILSQKYMQFFRF